MTDRFAFDHFLEAQDGGVYERAMAGLQEGRKRTHWMWFVFPQIEGLGTSAMARRFALSGIDEAAAYALHDDLGPRLYDASEAMLEWAGTLGATDILDEVDAVKFRSAMTLFEAACDDDQVFADALDGFYDGERCPLTRERIARNGKVRA